MVSVGSKNGMYIDYKSSSHLIIVRYIKWKLLILDFRNSNWRFRDKVLGNTI